MNFVLGLHCSVKYYVHALFHIKKKQQPGNHVGNRLKYIIILLCLAKENSMADEKHFKV